MNRWAKTALIMGAAGAGVWLASRARRGPAYDFQGKVVLITGGSRGLGLVLAREFAGEGARVAICAREEDELRRAAEDLRGHGPAPLAVPCDLSDFKQVQQMIERVQSQLGPIDVLVNNAGIIGVGPAVSMTLDDYHQAMDVNYWGTVHTIEAVLPAMRQRQQGRIVNISSIGGKIGVPHLAPYCASKFAVVGLGQALRAELARDGIVVTTICPGLMRTGSPRHGYFKGESEAEYAWFKISDSLPLLTVSAEHAAAQVLEGCRSGEAEVIISLPAHVAITFNSLFPELSSRILELVDRFLLPGHGGGTRALPGAQSESWLSRSFLTALTQKAARHNNQGEALTPHQA